MVALLLMAADEHARQLNLTPVRRVELLAVPLMALCSLFLSFSLSISQSNSLALSYRQPSNWQQNGRQKKEAKYFIVAYSVDSVSDRIDDEAVMLAQLVVVVVATVAVAQQQLAKPTAKPSLPFLVLYFPATLFSWTTTS